ncbi:MAG TPA: hypothetical protein DEB16_01615, partial [Ruminococcaceae bacterium]|nr:hypothetical protein [Oscillospiraceae bacterium]
LSFSRPGTLVPPDIERDEPDAPEAEAPARPSAPRDAAPAQGAQASPAPAAGTEPEEKFVGEAFGTYIIVQRGDSLVFYDKHAVHERLLYEKLKKQGGASFSQMLLEPVTVTLSKEEYSAVLESR